MHGRLKCGFVEKLAALAALLAMPITPIAPAQCPPQYEVDFIQPTSCGVSNPAITAWGISLAGDLCGTRGGCGDTDGGPFAWFGEPPIIDIPEPAAYPLADAYGINSLRQVVGRMHAATGNTDEHAFLYENGIVYELPRYLGQPRSTAFAINDAGISCGYSQSGPTTAVIWQDGSVTALSLPLGPNSAANSISNNGVVCGWMGSSSTRHAFTLDLVTREPQDLGIIPGGQSADAKGISPNGEIVCGSGVLPLSPGPGLTLHAFIYAGGMMTDLGTLPGQPRSNARSVNDAGQVVGESYNENLVGFAFIWQNGIMHKLNDLVPTALNLNIQIASGINTAGQIAASGRFNGGGAYVALRLNPVPPQPGDCTCDWLVNVADIMEVIGNWGECPPQFTAPCTTDFNNDHRTGVPDLLHVINHWGQGSGLP